VDVTGTPTRAGPPPMSTIAATAVAHLRSSLSPAARVLTGDDDLAIHARDLAELPAVMAGLFQMMPTIVVQPAAAADVAAAVAWARQQRLPVTPRGLASSAYGGAVPARGGLVLDLLRLNAIGPVDEAQRLVTVEAGVGWGDLERVLEPLGLDVHTCPSSRFSTVGGWVNTGGYGLNAVGHGHFSRHVTSLEVVLPDGTVVTATPGDPVFGRAFGTEGQFGVVTALTLALRRRRRIRPHLAYADSTGAAVALATRLRDSGAPPEHIKLIDRRQLANLNRLHGEAHAGQALLESRDGVLFTFSDEAAEARFLRDTAPGLQGSLAPRHVASWLWQERFFPMAAKRFGPSLLAAQLELPLERAAAFIDEAAALAARFGVTTLTESYVLDTDEALVMPMFACDARRPSYLLHLVLVQLMTRLGLRHGGRPYAAGLWNGAFAAAKFGDRHAELVKTKQQLDPDALFNPGKFPRVKTRLAVLDVVFWPPFFLMLMTVLLAMAPLLGPVARGLHRGGPPRPAVPRSDRRRRVPLDDAALEEAIRGCTGCGDCLPVCPAFTVTGDETVVGRQKLRTGLRLLQGDVVSKSLSDQTFLCMLCHACEDVCQSNLPLVSMYEVIEGKLARQHGRPTTLISDFIARAEALPAYHALVGTKPPLPAAPSMPDGFLPPGTTLTTTAPRPTLLPAPSPSGGRLGGGLGAGSAPAPGARYAITARPALARTQPVGRFTIVRGDDCIGCGHCISACVYGVHSRDVVDIRRLAEPASHLCKDCFRCVQECPRRTLTMSLNPAYDRQGSGIFTPDVVMSLMRQAERGAIPVLGQGYRGPFSGAGFDGMWTDMSEIVRPTRDGIHGREFISTAIDLGRRAERLIFDDAGQLVGDPPLARVLPIPVLFARLPGAEARPLVTEAMLGAARTLQTLVELEPRDWRDAFSPFVDVVALVLHAVDDVVPDALLAAPLVEIDLGAADSNHQNDDDIVNTLRRRFPTAQLAARLPFSDDTPARVVALTRSGVVDVVRLVGEDGTGLDSLAAPSLVSALPLVHDALVTACVRDRITLIASGGLAMAEHVPKAIILGCDGVAIDWPLAIALGCLATPQCIDGHCSDGGCHADLASLDVAWGRQRIENLMAAWRNQLLEVMGAMGLREVRRLRGERGRAMFARDLVHRHFDPLRAKPASLSTAPEVQR
jgi:FAD/FMN-containing dehydrogenase/ferredoxin